MADISSVKLPDASEYDVTDAEALHSSDPVNNLNSTSTTLPLAANMGHALADNLAANENAYGAKNKLKNDAVSTTINDVIFTVNEDKSVTANGTSTGVIKYYLQGSTPKSLKDLGLEANVPYILSGGVSNAFVRLEAGGAWDSIAVKNAEETFTVPDPTYTYIPQLYIQNNVTLNNVTFKPMIRDARVIDPTFAPFAETNLQLTDDKAERADLSAIHATGSTNTTGTPINAGSFFYLNGQFCKALQYIDNGATFTKNTNYELTNIGKELSEQTITAITGSSTSYTIHQNAQYSQSYYMKRGGFVYVNILVNVVASESSWTAITNNLPQISGFTTINPPVMKGENATDSVFILLQNNVLYAKGGTVGKLYAVCFCYPA